MEDLKSLSIEDLEEMLCDLATSYHSVQEEPFSKEGIIEHYNAIVGELLTRPDWGRNIDFECKLPEELMLKAYQDLLPPRASWSSAILKKKK